MCEGRNFGGACYSSVERCVYMVGGCLTEESSSVEKLDLKTGTWKKLANTKTKRDSPGVVSDQLGNIYAIGKPLRKSVPLQPRQSNINDLNLIRFS